MENKEVAPNLGIIAEKTTAEGGEGRNIVVVQVPAAEINIFATSMLTMQQAMSGIGSTMSNIFESVALNNPGENVKAFRVIHEKINDLNETIANLLPSVDNSYFIGQRDFYMNESILMRKRQKRMLEQFNIE